LPDLEHMFLGEPSEKGLSLSRKWGVKAHMERNNHDQSSLDPNIPHPFDWESAYRSEQLRIEELSEKPAQ
jgi:serine protease AprX